jgi:hypothetical protein
MNDVDDEREPIDYKDLPPLGGRMLLGLSEESWATIFETLHRPATLIRAKGDFWAAVQSLEEQYDRQTGVSHRWT